MYCHPRAYKGRVTPYDNRRKIPWAFMLIVLLVFLGLVNLAMAIEQMAAFIYLFGG